MILNRNMQLQGGDEYSNPHNPGNLATRFPEATIIMAHMGEES